MPDWKTRALDADRALEIVKSGMRVFVHGAAATPTPLLDALGRRTDLQDVQLVHMHTEGAACFTEPECRGRFFSVSLFTGPALRQPIHEGNLFGRTLRQRAEALISIAHPDFRRELARAYAETRHVVL
jgi:acyl-CoA hydrolase